MRSPRWRALQVRGWLLLGHGDRARRCLEDWLKAEPAAASALSSRAYLRAQAGELEAACDDYQRLLRHRADDAAAWFNLGFVLQRRGRWLPAQQALQRAVDLQPGLDRAWYGLGTVLMQQERWDDAATALRRATALQPMSPFGWVQLARVEHRRQRPEAAQRIVQHLRGFEPGAAVRLADELGLEAAA